ncbi:TetR/AcrR family transcriptional regulator [Heyndrickxia sporothermodurans]
MKQRKMEMIECAIKLFAEKGYQSTSVQDIVSEYGISKGAFYNYFSSKEELLLAIFQHYSDKIYQKMNEIQEEKLSPREIMKKQIIGQFEFFIEHRDFIVMYFREQNQSINKELRQFLAKNSFQALKNTEKSITSIYGDKIHPFICDIILACEGIKNSYIKLTVFDGIIVDLQRLAEFILKRIDDMVKGFLENGEEPIVKGSKIEEFICDYKKKQISPHKKVKELLHVMEKEIDRSHYPNSKKEELLDIIHFLLNETNKKEIKTYIFQGMLAHFNGIQVLEKYLTEIANQLKIDLL